MAQYDGGDAAGDQPLPDARGTIQGPDGYDKDAAVEDAKALRKAFKGFGCDKDTVIAIASGRTSEQRQLIREAFLATQDKDLIKELKSELRGNLEDLCVPLFLTQGERDARWLKQAFDGFGADRGLLMEIMCTRTNAEINKIMEAWPLTGADEALVSRMESETSKLVGANSFQKFMLALLRAEREPNADELDDAQVRLEAEELNRLLEQDKGAAKEKFVELFAARSFRHLAAISHVWAEISQKYTLEAAIKETFGDGSDTAKALGIVAEFSTQPYDFWAKKLRKAMKGMGTDDELLIRVLASRCEIDMDNIRKVFSQRHGDGKTLAKCLKDDLSSGYEKLALKICGF